MASGQVHVHSVGWQENDIIQLKLPLRVYSCPKTKSKTFHTLCSKFTFMKEKSVLH